MWRPRLLAVALFACSVALMVGCGSGSKRNAVSGTVKYKGAPIPNGTITFLDQQGGVAGGAPIKNGAFEIGDKVGLAAGTYKVSISYPDPKGTKPDPKEGEAPGEGASPEGREVKDLLPAKYNTATELTAEVKDGGPNEFPFDLK